ncbi:acyl-CoA dehydrogenase [Tamaricihabitans halophyticus]|uniref:Acyl-CoA dehydrogenase n=1 Tax=Tamaricihabitans halophyticus TaxID=1262583 RepID=A0A4R2R1Q1_9PSEU|nr:acyl-CoA dehydrogenase family protein [Tamaricihabitans halophyticus]TCP56433.1 acyl-CoA dehydrogenase [Tamaricihabitans halophyticus]
MSEHRGSIAEAVAGIIGELSGPEAVRLAEPHGWNEPAWRALAEAAFTTVAVPEEHGGSGGDIADACEVLTAVGRFAAAVPVAENCLLAGWALSSAGLALPGGPVTMAVGHPADTAVLRGNTASWRLNARLHRVPWARQATHIALLADLEEVPHVVLVPHADAEIQPGSNLAGEARDGVVVDAVVPHAVPAPAGIDTGTLRLRGALGRAAAMSGALARINELTLAYTGTRQQFGRTIDRFQAVQRHIVRIAEHANAAAIAVEAAAANARPLPDVFDVAAAKIVCGEASGIVAAAAHQAHGAIGMTKEYELGQLTRRLWSWRDEFGTEALWSELLGEQLAAAGAAALWPRISTGRVVGNE